MDYGDRKPLLKFISKETKMTKYIDRYYLNWELYGIKFGGEGPIERPDLWTPTFIQDISVSISWSELQGICFSKDWKYLYYSDYYQKTVGQMTLSTNRDISTATDTWQSLVVAYDSSWLAISDDWRYFFIACWTWYLLRYNLSTPYDISSWTLDENISYGSNLTWISFSDEWKKVYYMSYSESKIKELSLASPWTLTWATSVWEIAYPISGDTYRDCAVSPKWWKIFMVKQMSSNSSLYQMNMSTDNDITTATLANSTSVGFGGCGIFISPDWTKMYLSWISNKKIYQYSLS